MDNKDKLISLKEAAEISGYSSDYIGQLIRSGKIYGQQVYVNVTWMTTAAAVLGYKKKKSDSATVSVAGDLGRSLWRRIAMQFNALRFFLRTLTIAWPLVIALFMVFVLINIFLAYYFSRELIVPPDNPGADPPVERPLSF